MGFIQIAMLLVQIFPSALKALQAWKEYHEKEIDAAHRKQLAADIKDLVQTAIDTKNTAGIEDAIKNLGKPVTPVKLDSQNPS